MKCVLLTLAIFLLAISSFAQRVPKNLEVTLSATDSWHGGYRGSSTTLSPTRRVESAEICLGCLPNVTLNVLDLLAIQTQSTKRQGTRKSRPKMPRATLRNRISKGSVRNIWRDLNELVDSRTVWSEIECNWNGVLPISGSGKWRSIELSYQGFSKKFSVREDCELKKKEDREARTLLIGTFDKVVARLSGVKRVKVPWNSPIGRNLKRTLVQNKLPKDFVILIEDEAGGLGKRFWVKDDRKVRSASYSTRETIRLEGIELPGTKKKSEKNPKKLPKRLTKHELKEIFNDLLDLNFFEMPPEIRQDYISGPPRYSVVSFRMGKDKMQTKIFHSCSVLGSTPFNFCGLYSKLKDTLKGAKQHEEAW